MFTVYRVENQEGKGPYQGVISGFWRTRPHESPKHPAPSEENRQFKNLVKKLNPLFACPDKTSLKKWFKERI